MNVKCLKKLIKQKVRVYRRPTVQYIVYRLRNRVRYSNYNVIDKELYWNLENVLMKSS